MAKLKNKKSLVGTIRINRNLKVCEKTKSGWKKSARKFPNAIQVAKLFKANKEFKEIIDKKNPVFLKGQIYKGKVQGARINILPDGRKLDKAYSLFAENLTIHDESSGQHWNVLYKNPNSWEHLYTLNKRKNLTKKKYDEVKEFKKLYPKIRKRIISALKDKDDYLALPMFTLLETYMRIGNELYYKLNKHKGLTTLKKSDITTKGSFVTFNYVAKDGVPTTIKKKFPAIYIRRLKTLLNSLGKNAFVFTKKGKILEDDDFKNAFKKYCGKEFYPHIVRSYYATSQAEDFLKKHKKASKDEINNLFLSIAAKLGHKKFNKKQKSWQDNSSVTIHHYIPPDLVERVKKIEK